MPKDNKKQPLRREARHLWKEKRSVTLVYILLRTSVVLVMLAQIFNRNFENVFLCVLTLLLFMMPSVMKRKLDVELPNTLEIIILLFIYAAEILGEIGAYYVTFPYWDTVLHTLNGFLCAAIGFSLVDILNRSSSERFNLSPLYMAIVAFCFSMTVGVIWEFFECTMDQLFFLDMQKDTVVSAIGSIMLQSANNALGTTCVAAFTAAMRIKMFFMCPFESLGMAMATYSGQNYGAGKPERIWMGVKASALMMIIYWAFTFCVLMLGARTFALLFVDAAELEILKNTELFLHISVSFFPVLGLLCILRYTIQGVGYTNLAMLSGVSEMIARILVSLFAVPAFGYLAVCFGDPTAWIFADAFLIPAFFYVYRRILRMKKN